MGKSGNKTCMWDHCCHMVQDLLCEERHSYIFSLWDLRFLAAKCIPYIDCSTVWLQNLKGAISLGQLITNCERSFHKTDWVCLCSTCSKSFIHSHLIMSSAIWFELSNPRVILNYLFCYLIWALKSKSDTAPCDKKCCSEHQTLFIPHAGGYETTISPGTEGCTLVTKCLEGYTVAGSSLHPIIPCRSWVSVTTCQHSHDYSSGILYSRHSHRNLY